jgi:hypothetical protein
MGLRIWQILRTKMKSEGAGARKEVQGQWGPRGSAAEGDGKRAASRHGEFLEAQ